MATTHALAVSMAEYLRTSYEYDAEWVDGEVVERSLPNYSHTRVESRIVHRLVDTEAQAKILSPGDAMAEVYDKLSEYAAMGICRRPGSPPSVEV
jgi:hypothetical protein